MYYLKCKYCNHLNEVKSEYMVVCGLCSRKLDDNYKDWKVHHPERSFEDFQKEVCLTEEQVKRGELAKASAGKKNKKGIIAGVIGGVLMLLFAGMLVMNVMDTLSSAEGDPAVPVAERQWYTGTYAGGVGLTTPSEMKSVGTIMSRLPDEVKKLVQDMQNYRYTGHGVEIVYAFAEYVPAVEKVDVDGAAEGALNQLRGQRGVFDLKNDKAYVQDGELVGIVMQGSFVQRGTEYEFNITMYTSGLKLYQLICSNKKGDDDARAVVRRVIDSFQVPGHETNKTEQ